jgi:hypothetical protein
VQFDAPGEEEGSSDSGVRKPERRYKTMVQLQLTPEEARTLREALVYYLTDFRRQVAGAENPDFRDTLEKRQTVLEKVVARLEGASTQAA